MKAIIIIFVALIAAPTFGQVSIYLEGESGIFVGSAGKYGKLELTEDNFQFTVDRSVVHGGLHITAYENDVEPDPSTAIASVSVEGPIGGFPAPGHYEAVEFKGATSYYAGLGISGTGDACSQLVGDIEVHEITYDIEGNIGQLAADFRIRCKNALRYTNAKLRLNSTIPLHLQPVAHAGVDQTVSPGSTVFLDGSSSSSEGGVIASYQWRQVGGPPVVLNDAKTALPSFVFPIEINSGVIELELEIEDDQGRIATDRMLVQAGGVREGLVSTLYDLPHNYWAPIEIVRQEFDSTLVDVTRTMRKGVLVKYNKSPLIEFEQAGEGELDIDNSPFSAANRGAVYGNTIPSLHLYQYCDYIYGPSENSFYNIVDRAFDDAGNITRFAIDYEDQCNNFTTRRLMGRIRYNSLIPVDDDGIYAIAGSDIEVVHGNTANLIGFFSYSARSSRNISSYDWQQVGGPIISISNPTTPVALIDTSMLPEGAHLLTFRLTVNDSLGRTASDEVRVRVIAPETPKTRAVLISEPGSWVGEGRVLAGENNSTAEIRLQQNDPELYPFTPYEILNLNFLSRDRWSINLQLPEGELLREGSYFNLQRIPYEGQPSFSIGVNARGCSGAISDIHVSHLRRDERGRIQALALDFDTFCSSEGSKLKGYYRFNSEEAIPVNQPNFDLLSPALVSEGKTIQIKLDALDRDQLDVKWDVFLGPKFTLAGADTLSPYLLAPSIPPGEDKWLVFRAKVRDAAGNFSERYASVRIQDSGQNILDWVETDRKNDKPILLEDRTGNLFGFRILSGARSVNLLDLELLEADLPEGLGISTMVTPIVSSHVSGVGGDGAELYIQGSLSASEIVVAYQQPDGNWIEAPESHMAVEKLESGWTRVYVSPEPNYVAAPPGKDYGHWLTVAIGNRVIAPESTSGDNTNDDGSGSGSQSERQGGGGSIGSTWLGMLLLILILRMITINNLALQVLVRR
ncbi:PKD domain-containing protein [Microbulbifer yueqingensis]|uniref:PKD/Chitinase domain-containing protein n=1 Tax=Microbulbifer yueqingensis TaxID=658219 RepID=A0A1G9DQY3_9GAMM|nr:hypothetical protein [Microbulbifer yueqingensis]SDK66230.1 hypothetical protein SAMN05216212_2919 [Microbulbifer yueqingensis]